MMMKQVFSLGRCGVLGLLGLGVAALGGCPVYPDDSRSDYVCTGPDGCDGYRSGYPLPDCGSVGCPSNSVCTLTGGRATCEPTRAPGATSACKTASDCSSDGGLGGPKCLTGTCVAAESQCADATQCAAGSQCVQGACTPSCNANKPCSAGYACDLAKGVCTAATTTCANSNQCGGGTVCVQQHCVEPCSAEATCPSGLTCVDGGCTPEARPIFTCAVDGTKDKCQTGSLCLRHSCYLSCDIDAGANGCKNADAFNVCKSVTTSSGPHAVCGSSTNLGTECGPSQGKSCASSLVCIDGFCR